MPRLGQLRGDEIRQMNDSQPITLSQQDSQALDALVEAGFDDQQVDPHLRPRARQVMKLLGLLDHLPAPSPGDLVTARTLHAVEKARQQARFDDQIDRLGSQAAAGLRWPELISVAAVFLIGLSVLWPMLSHSRDTARQVACAGNLGRAAMGFSAYATEYKGYMPRTRTGDVWWETGRTDRTGAARSNSAHLFLLADQGFVDLSDLACPDNPHALRRARSGMTDYANAGQASFSFQNQFTPKPLRWGLDPETAGLADKNPFFGPGKYDAQPKSGDLSPNHLRLRGHNVMFNSGSVLFLRGPKLKTGDNLWLVGDGSKLILYKGSELPLNPSDSFLVP